MKKRVTFLLGQKTRTISVSASHPDPIGLVKSMFPGGKDFRVESATPTAAVARPLQPPPPGAEKKDDHG